MYENVLFQNAASLLEADIKSGRLPRALLFSGDDASGKLTAALETARVLSCRAEPRGKWSCACASCMMHKALTSPNVMLLGPRDCSLEIEASAKAFRASVLSADSHTVATRYLFLRSVRKLQNRFSPILYKGSDKLSKIAQITGEMDERMEELDFEHELSPPEKVEEATKKISALAQKLEGDFMYDSIPIMQIRNLEDWAYIAAADGKKVVIIEKAERMLEGVRNALLKILEEPPSNCVFILTSARRSAIMPTILSRVRTYNFSPRTNDEARQIVDRVFHDNAGGSIQQYLEGFLPSPPNAVKECARAFFAEILSGKIPEAKPVIDGCAKFEPRVLFTIFLEEILSQSKKAFKSAAGTQAALECKEAVQKCYANVLTYNQGIQAALECLVRDIALANKRHSGALLEGVRSS